MDDYSSPEHVKFQTLQDACKLAKPVFQCVKVDLQSTYRSVCIHSDNYKVTGLKWTFQGDSKDTQSLDSWLSFNGDQGPSHFHSITQAVQRCLATWGWLGVVAYIDDFFLAGSSKGECERILSTLIQLLRDLGFNISWKKVLGPTQWIRFPGVDIDTGNSTLSSRQGKHHQQLQQFVGRTCASKVQLQWFAGSFNWARQVVYRGKFFLRQILDTIRHLQHPRHIAKLLIIFTPTSVGGYHMCKFSMVHL